MLLLYLLPFVPLLATMDAQPTVVQRPLNLLAEGSRRSELIGEGILNVVDTLFPVPGTTVEARKKKKLKLNKYLIPLIVGFMLIKSILLPIALKTLAILSGKAVVLSLMSLVLAAIVGLKKVAQSSGGHNYDIVSLPSGKYRRQDIFDFAEDTAENEPYKFYRERRRKK